MKRKFALDYPVNTFISKGTFLIVLIMDEVILRKEPVSIALV